MSSCAVGRRMLRGGDMTDSLKGVIVAFDRDIRVDDAEPLIEAIKMIKGVADVSPSVADMNDYSARVQVRCQLADAFLEMHKAIFGK